MALAVPHLHDTRISFLTACCIFDKPEAPDWLPETGKTKRVGDALVRFADDKEYLQVIYGRFRDGDGHFHLNLAREGYFKELPERSCEIAEIQELFAKVSGLSAHIRLAGEFVLPATSVPKRGLISVLNNFSATAGGETVSLKSAEVSISGDFYAALSWKTRGENIEGQLEGWIAKGLIEESLLENAVVRLERGINRFVLELDDETPHGKGS